MGEKQKKIIKGFHLYIPENLLEDYRGFADEDGRSVNAEIIWVLEQFRKKKKNSL